MKEITGSDSGTENIQNRMNGIIGSDSGRENEIRECTITVLLYYM